MLSLLRLLFCTLVICACSPAFTFAELSMTLRGTPGSSIIEFELAGSSIAEEGFSSLIIGHTFEVLGQTDPFPVGMTNPENPFGEYPVPSGSATFTIEGFTVPVTHIVLQDEALFGHPRFGVVTPMTGPFDVGARFAWSGVGTIDLSPSTLTFDDLNVGTWTGTSIVGLTTGSLTIAAFARPGDYNSNGVIDAADYTVWQDNVGADSLPNRSEGIEGPVGQADYDFWISQFAGGGSGAVAVQVPETGVLKLCAIAGVWRLGAKRKRLLGAKTS